MEQIKLNEEQKKIFDKYNLYLNAVLGDNGVSWTSYIYYDDGMESLDGPTPNISHGWERKDELAPEDPGYDIMCELADNIVKQNEDNFYDYLDDEYARNGSIYLTYNPQTKIFTLGFDAYVRKSEDFYQNKTFDEIFNQPLPWYAANQDRVYTKLKSDEYIQELINKHNGETFFEFPYNGYGDSGEIDSSLSYNDDVLNIAYEIIDLFFGGWENNEGADGTVTINLEEKKVTISHSQYYEDTEHQEITEVKII